MRGIKQRFISIIGWVVILNLSVGTSMLGWIPYFTGISFGNFLLYTFILSVPAAVWCDSRLGNPTDDDER